MKKFVKILCAFIMVLSITGCYKINMEMNIAKDSNVSYKAIMAVNKTLISSMGDMNQGGESNTTDTTENKDGNFNLDDYLEDDDLLKAGYKVEEYSYKDENNYEWVGYTISKDFGKIKNLLLEKPEVITMMSDSDDDSGVLPEKLFSKDGNTYKAQFLFDFSAEDGEDTEDSMISLDQMDQYFNLSFQITLPNKAVSNNADEVSEDGKTLKWIFHYGKKTEVNFEFELKDKAVSKSDDDKKSDDGKPNIMLFVAIGGAVAAVAVVGVLVVVLTSKKKNTQPTNVDSNVQ